MAKTRKIIQIIPALPGTWALHQEESKEGPVIDFALPIVCWALVEEQDEIPYREVVAQEVGHHGSLDFCDESEGFIGIAFYTADRRPPNARDAIVGGNLLETHDLLSSEDDGRQPGVVTWGE